MLIATGGPRGGGAADQAAVRHMRAWLALVAALAIHVADEAATDFLGFYNPLVLAIRERVSWFPVPTFTFGPWLTGLVLAVGLLALLAPAVRRGAAGTLAASYLFSIVMFVNGLLHLGGSLYLQRWLPGATSAPLLLLASALLAASTWQRRP